MLYTSLLVLIVMPNILVRLNEIYVPASRNMPTYRPLVSLTGFQRFSAIYKILVKILEFVPEVSRTLILITTFSTSSMITQPFYVLITIGSNFHSWNHIISEQKLQISTAEPERQKIYVYLLKFLFLVFLPFSKIIIS